MTRGTSSLVIADEIFLLYRGKLRDFVKIASEFTGCAFFGTSFFKEKLGRAICHYYQRSFLLKK
jgi:hypothetical protein